MQYKKILILIILIVLQYKVIKIIIIRFHHLDLTIFH